MKPSMYKSVFDLTADALIVLDERGAVVEINRAYTALTGRTLDDLQAAPLEEFLHADDVEATREAVQRLVDGEEVVDFANRHRCVDESLRMISWRAKRSEDDGRVYCVGTDVTKLAALAADVERLQGDLETIVESTSVAIVTIDATRHLTWANSAAATLMGYDAADEIIGRSLDDFILPEDVDQQQAVWLLEQPPGATLKSQRRLRRKDGAILHAFTSVALRRNADGDPVDFVVQYVDITDRVEAERALAQSEARMRSLIDASPDTIWTTNTDGDFVEPQRGWQRLTGQAWPDHAGRGWLQMLHPDDRDDVTAEIDNSLPARDRFRIEARIWNTSRREFRLSTLSGAPVADGDGQVIEWVGAISDIHDDHRMMQALQSANEELERFAGSIAHDLQTPLVSIHGFARLLPTILDEEDLDQAKMFAERIQVNVDRASNMVKNLLGYAQAVGADTSVGVVGLDDGVEWVRSVVADQLGESGGELVADPLPHVMANATAVQQILLNLVSNSIKYRRPDRPPVIRISGEIEGNMAAVTVEDNGRGIPPDRRDRIFDLGVRAVDDVEGAGIGLASCRMAVSRHGGAIELADDPADGGTAVRFTLPLAPEAPRPSATL